MRITVTGGFGFIARRLVEKLVENGHEVNIIDHALPFGEYKSKACVLIGDLKIERLKEFLSNTDVVYHLAEYHEDAMMNAMSTLNVLEACRITRPKKIIYASSFHVYEGLNEKHCGQRRNYT
ncbi:MAG: NAD-dependent epimerase/dehydratase family protein [Thermoproteota archaeon]